MTTVKVWAQKAQEMKEKGLSDREIAQELHLSPETITWLLTRRETTENPPADVKIGWRSIGVSGGRLDLTAAILVDIIDEEMENSDKEIDAVVGLAMNGIPLATFVATQLGCDFAIFRPTNPEQKEGHFLSNYASVKGKKVVLVDDVIGTGRSMKSAFKAVRECGGEPIMGVAVVNKTPHNMLEDVPIRALVRARAMTG
ncbi:MAG: orotate phosphoribosyltransferase-like protein [Candidatus Thermoplasmatota archaeon]|nr:orotate phosphoribosyltransferase-like protein [Candidatus Thermoplasmatota archaeon]